MVLEKTLESPLDHKEIKPVNPKGKQPWIFIGRTDAEVEAPLLWPPDAKSQVIRKDPDVGKDWKQEEKEMTKEQIVGWHHWLNGYEFEQAPGVGDGQGSLVCCSPWGHRIGHDWVMNNNNNNHICHLLRGQNNVQDRSINCCPWAKSDQPSNFISYFYWDSHICLFVYGSFFRASAELNCFNRDWPVKLQIFTFWSFGENVYESHYLLAGEPWELFHSLHLSFPTCKSTSYTVSWHLRRA